MKYAEINSIEAIDAARQKLAVEIDRKEDEIRRNFETARDSYSVTSMTVSAVRKMSGIIPLDRIALFLIRKIIKVLK